MTYHAPVKRLRFALDAVANLERLYGNAAYGELSADLVDAVLEEAGRFASEVIAPLNRTADKEGAKLENGNVTLPTGFEAAYKSFVANGWNAITGPTEFGGQAELLADVSSIPTSTPSRSCETSARRWALSN